jgi:hypothetical protein
MRDIGAWSLIFWCFFGAAACVPSVPSAGKLPPATSNEPPDPAPGSADPTFGDATGGVPGGPPARGPGAGGPPGSSSGGAGARADGGAAGRPGDGGAASADASGGHAAASDVPRARAPRPGELVIDELLVDPAGNDLGHEWLEIANVASEALDLSALRVSDEATEVAVDAGVLGAGGFLVLGQSLDRAHNGDAPVDLAYGTKLSLNNGADRIAICDGPCAGGVTLDAVAWTAPWGDAFIGHAVVVERTGATCPAEEPYGAGGNFGSPGHANPPCPEAAESDGGADANASDGEADARAGDGNPRDGAADR